MHTARFLSALPLHCLGSATNLFHGARRHGARGTGHGAAYSCLKVARRTQRTSPFTTTGHAQRAKCCTARCPVHIHRYRREHLLSIGVPPESKRNSRATRETSSVAPEPAEPEPEPEPRLLPLSRRAPSTADARHPDRRRERSSHLASHGASKPP